MARSYAIFALSLLNLASLAAAPAATVNVDNDYRDAAALFQRRDIVSCLRTINLLEKNLEKKPDHLDSQALISFAYAHEAFILSQLGESGTEYMNSADAFSKAVLTQQPKNPFARKAAMMLQLIAGNALEVRKTLEKEMTDKETDADLWYISAIVGEGDKTLKSLTTALNLNADHIWIYNDMAFRALKMNDLTTAEKWVRALEARRPGLADADLLKAAIAAQKRDKKAAQGFWVDFTRKAPEFSLVAKFGGRSKK